MQKGVNYGINKVHLQSLAIKLQGKTDNIEIITLKLENRSLLSLEKDPDPLSPITPGCLGPETVLFNCVITK